MAYEQDDEWISRTDAQSLAMEKGLRPEESDIEQAERLLKENAPHAALQMIDLATQCPNPNIRLRASAWVLDRVLPDKGVAAADDPLTKMVKMMQQNAEEFANQQKSA